MFTVDKRRKPQSLFLPELCYVSQDEDSDDDPTVFALSGMSPAESILSDEGLLLDQFQDFKNPDKSTKTEGAVVVVTGLG